MSGLEMSPLRPLPVPNKIFSDLKQNQNIENRKVKKYIYKNSKEKF